MRAQKLPPLASDATTAVGVARTKATVTSSSPSSSPFVRVHIGDEGGAYPPNGVRNRVATLLARHSPLRSPCRRGFASRRSAPVALRRVNDDRPRGRGGEQRDRDSGSSCPRIARRVPATYCATAGRHGDQSTLDDRRVESGVGVLPIAPFRYRLSGFVV